MVFRHRTSSCCVWDSPLRCLPMPVFAFVFALPHRSAWSPDTDSLNDAALAFELAFAFAKWCTPILDEAIIDVVIAFAFNNEEFRCSPCSPSKPSGG